ncbi:class I SAM-dependent methyltransferase [Maribacter algarum]|uniref:Class I SAM-dependent methyltransferase n=1 Tax=Maribacter algarum (ex Zhang et al. 2020) TaxID=2578118 RepID=A0A5S3PHU3_9FLAO|nr:class I SAM-dependent methyltransferase [Maribacter algarum]TMM53838.1 class I SAM-dependent methyltransferase [Maribacter algarum]
MEQEILKSWNENADEWIKNLEERKISSREITDKAIVAAISELDANNILDCGCGEGWLTRSMTEIGKNCVGIDATSRLIENARLKGSETFHLMSYEDVISEVQIPESPFDTVVFNFCLYQKDGLVGLFKGIKKVIYKNGHILIQTLHPYFLKQQGLPQKSQWISDSWKGLSGDFKNGHKWYARTFEDWMTEFYKSELDLKEKIEVRDSEKIPLSVIYILTLKS